MSQTVFFARGYHSLNTRTLKSHEKMWLAKRVHSGQINIKKEAERLGLNHKLLYKYGSKYGKGLILQSNPGQPKRISLERGNELQKIIWDKEQEDDCVKHDEFEPLLNQSARKTAHDQRKPIPQPVSRSTMERTMKSYGIKSVKGQQTTDARFEAERDPRNAISSIIYGRYLRKTVPNASLLINFDATQMNKNEKNNTRDHVVRVRDEDHKAR